MARFKGRMKSTFYSLIPLDLEALKKRLEAWDCSFHAVEAPLDLLPDPEHSTVVLCTRSFLKDPEIARGVLARFNPLQIKVIYVGEFSDWEEAGLLDYAVSATLPADWTGDQLYVALRSALNSLERGHTLAILENKLYQFNDDFEKINNIGKALTAEHDLDKLLRLMLEQSLALTEADAGSIFLVEEDDQGQPMLRFKITHTFSIDQGYEEFTMPLTKKSIAGYVAATGEPLLLENVYELDPEKEYSFNQSYDKQTGYRTISMLVVPMIDHKGRIIGVIQLINRKTDPRAVMQTPEDFDRFVIPFRENHKDFIMAIAGEAAVALENSQLYDSIEALLEGLVEASVTAIESRDPTTSGHSFRVAAMTVRLAEKVDHAREGSWAPQRFSTEDLREIRYASLLHDFGKVGVREEVLVKAKKLYEWQFISIQQRFFWLRRDTEARFAEKKLALVRSRGEAALADFGRIDSELQAELERLDAWYELVCRSNEPSVLEQNASEQLKELHGHSFVDHGGTSRPLIDEEELAILSIPRGTLTPDDRKDIESHVTHTFEFLRRIPWTKELARVPEIAAAHHEKLDGKGYPLGLPPEQIPVGSRMMTIADIYDALTASDRPYKKAVPHQKALDILGFEVKDGKVDAELVEIFQTTKVWDVLKEPLR